MKKYIIPTLIAALLFLSACSYDEGGAPDDTAGTAALTETLNDEAENEKAPEEIGIYVVSITDRTQTEELGTDDALEGFHADEEYVYYFPSIKSHYVTVKYSDQSERPLKEAFYRSDITITDLDRYGIGYGKRSHAEDGDGRVKKIVYDIICYSNGGESDTEEIFYENSDYVYSFPNPLSDHITVRYTDGSEDNIKTAFERGNITPHDLISAGIPVWEESKLDGSATFYLDGEVHYHEP